MSSVNLQNSVRLRIFLILVISITIRIIRPLTSPPVHKATALLEMNYILYAIVILCTLLPLKTSWMVSIGALGVATAIDALVFLLTFIATTRCLSGSQIGCVHHSVADISCIALTGGISILDVMQTWTVYRILRIPSFAASATQRIRVVFSWNWPFAWMVNIVLWSASKWSIWTLPHIILDPTLVVLASTGEIGLLVGIMGFLLLADAIAWTQTHVTLAIWGIVTSATLTCVGLVIALTTVTDPPTNVPEERVTPTTNKPPSTINSIRKRHTKKSEGRKILF